MKSTFATASAVLLLLITGVSADTCIVPCTIEGAPGVQGPVGPEGPQGIQGQPGPQGPAGTGGGNMAPGGRLTLAAGKPTLDADTTSSTLWYAPYLSDTFPAFDGLAWHVVTFSASPLNQAGTSMAGGAKWTAGTSRDVFGTGAGAICTGPAWPASDLANRTLVRYNGVLVNGAAMTCDTSASASVSCPAYQCTLLGSVRSSVSGQLTAHFGYGQGRKFEVWNAYNQTDIVLHVGQPGTQYVPINQYPSWSYFNGDANNSAYSFTGLPTLIDVSYHQSSFINSGSGPSGIIATICLDGLNSVGFWAKFSSDTNYSADSVSGEARYMNSSQLGPHTLSMCIAKANGSSSTVWGGSSTPAYPVDLNSVMLVRYRG